MILSKKKAGHFDEPKKKIAQYLTKELHRGGNISRTILYMSMFVRTRPKKAKKSVGTVIGGGLEKD